jgi:hypothetical protein
MALGKKTGGRAKGSLNRATAEVRALASEYGEAALEELARLANEAESEQARIAACNGILKRAYGDSNGVPIEIDLPDTSTPTGVVAGIAAIIQAVSKGDISTEAGRDLGALIDMQRRAIELNDIEQRLRRLEGEALPRKAA